MNKKELLYKIDKLQKELDVEKCQHNIAKYEYQRMKEVARFIYNKVKNVDAVSGEVKILPRYYPWIDGKV